MITFPNPLDTRPVFRISNKRSLRLEFQSYQWNVIIKDPNGSETRYPYTRLEDALSYVQTCHACNYPLVWAEIELP